jgi:hypothetical protein
MDLPHAALRFISIFFRGRRHRPRWNMAGGVVVERRGVLSRENRRYQCLRIYLAEAFLSAHSGSLVMAFELIG